MSYLVHELTGLYRQGVGIVIIIGGGNYVRGSEIVGELLIERTTADYMGMIATLLNALALRDMLIKLGQVPAVVLSTWLFDDRIGEGYSAGRCMSHLHDDEIVIVGCGTGMPGVTTDTGAAQVAVDISAQELLKATGVEGIYTADPRKDQSATLIETISHQQVISRGLQFMDHRAVSLCEDAGTKIRVFKMDMTKPGILAAAFRGEVGSLVTSVAA
jgi:uridylate kinase